MPSMKEPPSLNHLIALTDDVGVIQHAVEDIPNRSTGYCVDDVARAYIVAVQAMRHPALRAEAARIGRIYLAYLFDAQRPDGLLRNFVGYDRRRLDDIGSEDSFGRAIWGLGYAIRFTDQNGWRNLSGRIIDNALRHVPSLKHLRSKAYAAIGLAHTDAAVRGAREDIRAVMGGIGNTFKQSYMRERSNEWRWFEPWMTYDNARIAEASLRIGIALGDEQLVQIGFESLNYYAQVVIENDIFVPIGNGGWTARGGERARFDQQPIEAAGMIDASLAAHEISGDAKYLRYAELSYDWFFGRNSIHALMISEGGCRDGFAEQGVNRNMGAESTLAYLASAFALTALPQPGVAPSGSNGSIGVETAR